MSNKGRQKRNNACRMTCRKGVSLKTVRITLWLFAPNLAPREHHHPKNRNCRLPFFEYTMVKRPVKAEEESPELTSSSEEDDSVYDSEDGLNTGEEEDFEDQGSSDDDDDLLDRQKEDDDSEGEFNATYEKLPRSWNDTLVKKSSEWMHTHDYSSDEDDKDGSGNRIGRVPIHWYDDFEHIGYDVLGEKVIKSSLGGDRIDQALAAQDNFAKGKFIVHDALNDRDIELSQRQLELIRRVQAGAYAHPEHESNPEYIDYFSGVDPEISGLNSNKHEPKARFQPSKYEKMQVDKLLEKLEKGYINMDYLTGKIRDMNDVNKEDPNKPFVLWKGDEEDELNLRKGPQHIAAPKMPPPGHAESYIPPDEYLPTEDDIKAWEEMEPKDRPFGHLMPKKFPNLRSVGAYEHSVRETFERCLDLYLCPRAMKRRLNIDPESLVPRLPKASDLRPFPTAKCVEYKTPYEGGEAPMIRCIAASPDGQFMASGATDGYLRLWEVQTGRLLRSWNLSDVATNVETERNEESTPLPIVFLDWNPNRSHHCLIAAVGRCIVVVATGTSGKNDADVTEALLSAASQGGNVSSTKADKAVTWIVLDSNKIFAPTISSFDKATGPVCALRTNKDVSSVRWQSKGDYFVSVSPKAGAASVLIHQLSKGNSQQPFSSSKGEAQLCCFHPTKPFLFVTSQQHIRVYHLVKQNMVKRLMSGCRFISSIDVHPSGDHLIVGSLDRRVVWFDLDLGTTPYKTLKYHERAIRASKFHNRYPLMVSSSDDAAVHVFHSMVYSDLMRNPLIVPVKILRGHTVTNKLGVLASVFHPTQPWVFTGGADGKIYLWQDI
jgi:ribosome biogenesis protein ERB1